MACRTCGAISNPTEPEVPGPAVILGNGTSVPFATDEAAEAYIARKLARGADPMTFVPSGTVYP